MYSTEWSLAFLKLGRKPQMAIQNEKRGEGQQAQIFLTMGLHNDMYVENTV